MDTGVFPNIKMQEYINQHFVPVRFVSGADADQFSRYEITAVPAFLVLDQQGNEVFREIGYCEADLFIEKLKAVRQQADHIKEFNKNYLNE